ncbi:MAG TPA: beta-propeller fold lactonase family protein, partial [Terriglobales bacterium]
MRLLRLIVPAALAVTLVGCGDFFTKDNGSSGGGGTPGTQFVFPAFGAASATSNTASFSINSDNTLTSANGALTTGIGEATAAAVTSDNQFLYVAGFGGIAGYQISSTGALTNIGQTSATGIIPQGIAISSDNSELFAVNLTTPTAPTISSFLIQSGALNFSTAVNLPANSNPIELAVAGSFLYVADGTDTVIYQVGTSSGAVTFAQVQCPTSPCTIPSQAVAIRNGQNLYVADSVSGQVAAYSLNTTTGVPTVVGNPVTGLAGPVSVALDGSNSFLLVLTQNDNTLSSYQLLANGGIGSRVVGVAAGTTPVQVRVNASTNTAYVANSQ